MEPLHFALINLIKQNRTTANIFCRNRKPSRNLEFFPVLDQAELEQETAALRLR